MFGEKMKEQVEERLRFYDEGIAPTKNTTAMQVPLFTAFTSLCCRSGHIAVLLVPSSCLYVCKPANLHVRTVHHKARSSCTCGVNIGCS